MDFVNFKDFNDWEIEDDDWESQFEAKVESRGEDRTSKRQRMQSPSPDNYNTHLPNSWGAGQPTSFVGAMDIETTLRGKWVPTSGEVGSGHAVASISDLLNNGFVSIMCSRLTSILRNGDGSICGILKDPTGELSCVIAGETLKCFPMIKEGTILILREVSLHRDRSNNSTLSVMINPSNIANAGALSQWGANQMF